MIQSFDGLFLNIYVLSLIQQASKFSLFDFKNDFMKQVFVISILIFLSSNAFSQPYESMFSSGDKESTVWIFKWSNLSGHTTDSAYVQKDTTVNGIDYKKIVTKYGVHTGYAGGLMREDVNAGIVWYRDIKTAIGDPNDTIERIAFRFDLNVGDTFDISNKDKKPGQYPITDNIVDSVKYINGLKYIYFRGQISQNEPITLIEGIGSNMGVIWKHYYGVMLGQYLLCSYKNGNKTSFVNEFYNGSCLVTGNVAEVDNEDKILLYPIPANNILNIDNQTAQLIDKLQIYNQIGQLVKVINSSNIKSLDVSDLVKGYYFLKLHVSNGQMIAKSFLVK